MRSTQSRGMWPPFPPFLEQFGVRTGERGHFMKIPHAVVLHGNFIVPPIWRQPTIQVCLTDQISVDTIKIGNVGYILVYMVITILY